MNIVPFDPVYSSENFECQDPHLTEYLRLGKAKKDLDSGQAAVFLLVNAAHEILGYYTLSSAAVSRKEHFTQSQAKKFRYPEVAVTLLGRIAIHRSLKGQGIGTELIAHALGKAAEAARVVASYAVVVDAKNARVAQIYAELGFVAFKHQPLKMFLPMETIRQMF